MSVVSAFVFIWLSLPDFLTDCGHALQNGNGPAPDGNALCNMACNGDPTETCGGPNRLNLYTCGPIGPVAPGNWSFLGCYTDSVSARSLPFNTSVPGGTGATSVESCQTTCLINNYVLAGVEYGEECCKYILFEYNYF
jgi:glucan 1,3-beta-glucosidase